MTTSAWRAWGLLALAVVLCLPPLIVGLGRERDLRVMEDISLVSSQETFLRIHGTKTIPAEERAWLMPSWNGKPRITKPPMLVWVHLLAWADLTPATSTPEQLAWRARGVAIGMTCLMIAGVFWIGVTLGDEKLGLVASLIAGTMWFTQRQATTAAYDIHMAAWATLAIAHAIAAIVRQSRRAGEGVMRGVFLYWVMAGVFLALAWMTKGPLALVIVLLPLVGMIAVERGAWRRNTAGLLLCFAVAAALALPWFIYAISTAPDTVTKWSAEYAAERNAYQPPWYYVGLFGLVLPWSVWFAAGLIHPFFQVKGVGRTTRLLPWIWFALIFVFFSIPAAKQQRYILPIVPAAALVAAFVLWDHARAALAGKPDPGAKAWLIPHWAGVMVASIALPPLMAAQLYLVESGRVESLFMMPISPLTAGVLCVVLAALAVTGFIVHLRGRAVVAALITALWMTVAVTPFWDGYVNVPEAQRVLADDAQAVAKIVDDAPLYRLDIKPVNPTDYAPDLARSKEFLFYSRRIVPAVSSAGELAALAQSARGSHAPVYVIADMLPASELMMKENGFEWSLMFRTSMKLERRLWKFSGKDAPP